jgi:hypothetical protein
MGQVKRVDTPVGRFYKYTINENKSYDEGGFKLMPSVTTVLGILGSDKLDKLEAEMGKEALQKLGQKAALRGTAMHMFLENYFICIKNGKDADSCLLYTQKKSPTDLVNDGLEEDRITAGRELFYNYLYEGYLERVKKVIFTERFIWSIISLFAGTADFCFVNEAGELIIGDFKSASSIKDDETIHKYELQLAAYIIAFEEIYNKKVHHAELWISHPHGIQERILGGDELEERKKQFLSLVEKYHNGWDARTVANKYCSAA